MEATIKALRNLIRSVPGESKALKKLSEGLVGENPVYALKWAGDALRAAAKHSVYALINLHLDAVEEAAKNGEDYSFRKAVGELDAIALQEIYAGARAGSASASTSKMSNLMEAEIAMAWVDVWNPTDRYAPYSVRPRFLSAAEEQDALAG